MCAAWTAVGTARRSSAVIWALMPFAALGAARRGHPFDAIYNHGIRHLLGTRRLPPHHAPRRFACGVATVWLAATGWAFHAGATRVGYGLGAVLVAVALVPATTDFCIPSFFYGLVFGRPGPCELEVAARDPQGAEPLRQD
jgi:hypothetical protein